MLNRSSVRPRPVRPPSRRTRSSLPATRRRSGFQAGAAAELRSLRELARACGIQTSFLDMAGKRQNAAPATLRSILQFWNFPAGNVREVQESLRQRQLQLWRRIAPPVSVVWDRRPGTLEVRLPSGVSKLHCKLFYEDGQVKNLDWRPGLAGAYAQMDLDGTRFSRHRLQVPSLPFGYHYLELDVRGRLCRTWIISAPSRSYSPPVETKQWGFFAPIYSIHTTRSWGAGNLRDWQELCQWLSAQGATVAGTLPLLATFLDHPACDPSPYSPVSRLFWNEFYLDLEGLPELKNCSAAQKLIGSPDFQAQLTQLRQDPFIDYPAQWQARRRVLDLLSASFFQTESPRRRQFDQWVADHPLVSDYAAFRATTEHLQTPWHKWEPRLAQGKLEASDYAEPVRQRHLYAQFATAMQLREMVDRCRRLNLKIYLDLPVGVHTDGFDMWRERDAFAFPANVGAPPDPVFTRGQNWGFAPLHPEGIRDQGYRYFRDCLQFQMRSAGMLRIDHVMGLHRLYWIPAGATANRGAYVSYHPEEFYAILCLESHRNRTILVGENLGTVPPEVNDSMSGHDLRQIYVAQYELKPDARQPLRRPPGKAVASLNTHDMPPFAAYWLGLDIEDRAALGLLSPSQATAELCQRAAIKTALTTFLQRQGVLAAGDRHPGALFSALCRWLRSNPTETLLINLEDLWQEQRSQNVPGTSTERPNWRRKCQFALEEIKRAVSRKTPAGKNELRDLLTATCGIEVPAKTQSRH